MIVRWLICLVCLDYRFGQACASLPPVESHKLCSEHNLHVIEILTQAQQEAKGTDPT